MSEVWRLRELLHYAAVFSWVTIATVSLAPAQDRTNAGGSGNVEHFFAYCVAAAVTRAALPHVQSRWQIILFSLASALFETCQIWIPGRSAAVDNWLASSVGAALGVILVRTVLHEDLLRFF